jgi:hypothetical protein
MRNKIILVGIVVLFFGASIFPSISGRTIFPSGLLGVDVQIEPDPMGLLQNEISLDLIPGAAGSPSLLIAAYNDHPYVGGPGLGVSHSTDGGVSWNAVHILPPLNPVTYLQMDDCFDPTITTDTLGNVFVGHISQDSQMFSGMYVHKSTDGGSSFSSPVTVAFDFPPGPPPDPNFRFNDRCQITADKSPASPYLDNVYLTWIKDRGFMMPMPYSDIYFSLSNDNGATFSVPITINEIHHDLANMPTIAVANDGTIYICWMHYDVWTGGIGTIYMDVSTNGGVSWAADIFVTNVNLPPLALTTGAGLTDVVSKGAPVIGVSPTNPTEVYITYAEDPDGAGPDECDIYLIRSLDGGATWGTPVRVNDDSSVSDQHLPWLEVKPDGTIDIGWYDRRNDPGDKLWDVYIARSIDGGQTWSGNVQINDQSFASPQNPWGIPWMGEYLGLQVDSTHAYMVFCTSINDQLGDVYFDKIANSQLPLPLPNLDCEGDLHFGNVKSGSTVTGDFLVKNVGDTGSLLDWEIESYPDWGVWTFDPASGDDLAAGGSIIVDVTVVAPKQVGIASVLGKLDEEYTGQVKVVNKDDTADYCIIDVSMMVPVNQQLNQFPLLQIFWWLFPNALPVLHSLIK